MKHPKAALSMLLAGMLLSYCWYWVPPDHQGTAWNVATCALVIYLLTQLGLVFSSPEIWLVAALLASFKMMVIGCDLWYAIDPWPVRPGQALCSARFNAPLGVVGLSFGALLAAAIYRGEK